MNLPIVLSQTMDLVQMQNRWASILNPVISNPSGQSIILPNVLLANGTTVVNHMLGRKLIGWRVIRIRGLAGIYDTQDNNQTPASTLILVSNAAVSVDLEVF